MLVIHYKCQITLGFIRAEEEAVQSTNYSEALLPKLPLSDIWVVEAAAHSHRNAVSHLLSSGQTLVYLEQSLTTATAEVLLW